MEIMKVPVPALNKGQVLVRNHYSVISAGTEGKTVKDARAGYLEKAKSRKEEVKKVIEAAKTYGISKTYEMVMNRLEAPSSLGYSSAGEVLEVGEGVSGFKKGDLVVCGGSGAVHAEVVAVSKNLVVKVPDGVLLNQASFSTIGAIALQGVRQASMQIGESCVVLGLGLIGLITVKILKAAGVKVIGVDLNEVQVKKGRSAGADFSFNWDHQNLEKLIEKETNGYGADAVIITASSSSNDIVNFAGAVSRQKGKVVVVGAVPTGFNRKNYYRKELVLLMSCSYGPGRYDSNYEEKGLDYPIGFVRWTENRNMEAFLYLLQSKKIDLSDLITHEFDFKEAPSAYDLILNRTESFCGITLKYAIEGILDMTPILINKAKVIEGKLGIGFVGAGSFAQNFLLPEVEKFGGLTTVVTARANTARHIAKKYGFEKCSCDAVDVMGDEHTHAVFIVTRHNLHFKYVKEGLENGKHVYVEKPLCLSFSELEQIKEVYTNSKGSLMIGFNRRYAPFIQKIKTKLNPDAPVAIVYRINAGQVPSSHWIHDPEIGGGRIVGEVCHFIDLAAFICNSEITNVSADSMGSAGLDDTLVINLKFKNGSIASISYFSEGNKLLEKEYLEVHSLGESYVVHDFKELEIYDAGGKVRKTRLKSQDKGHKHMIDSYLESIDVHAQSLISFQEIYSAMYQTFKVQHLIKN